MMAEILKEQGFQVAYVQVSKDYRVLELKTERIHQWAAKATAQGKTADLFSEVAYMEETASPPVSLNGRALQVLSFG
jgi:predicted ATPase